MIEYKQLDKHTSVHLGMSRMRTSFNELSTISEPKWVEFSICALFTFAKESEE